MTKHSNMTYRLYGLAPLLSLLLGGLPFVTGCDSGSSPPAEGGEPLAEAWRVEFPGYGGVNAAPLVVGDSAVLSSEDSRVILRAVEDGTLLWASSPLEPAGALDGEGFLTEGDLAFAVHSEQVLAWHLDTGELAWRYTPQDQQSNRFNARVLLAVDEEAVYGSGRQGTIRIDRKTGAELGVGRDAHVPRTIAVSGDTLFAAYGWAEQDAEGQMQGRIAALDKRTGEELWRFDTPYGGFIRVRPVIDGDRLYAGTVFGDSLAFFALDRHSGEAIWTTPDVSAYAAAYSEEAVFLNMGSRIAALDKQTGRVLWDTNLEAGHGESTLAYLAGYVYHGHESSLYVLDATTGEVVHRERAPDGSYFWEVGVGAGRVFVQTNRLLLCYEPFDPEAAR